MDNKQKANAYAIAKVLGYKKSIEDFIHEYSRYYDETYKALQSELPPNTAKAVKNPFRANYDPDFL